ALVESCALDVEVRLDDFELASERRELAFGTKHAAEQRREAQQRPQGARRSRLNQVADGRQSVEQKVRVDLGTECAQLRFRRELADFPLANLALVSLIRHPNRVDVAGDRDR